MSDCESVPAPKKGRGKAKVSEKIQKKYLIKSLKGAAQ